MKWLIAALCVGALLIPSYVLAIDTTDSPDEGKEKLGKESLGAACPHYGFHEKHTDCLKCHNLKPLEKVVEKRVFNTDFAWFRGNMLYFNFNCDIDNSLYNRFRDALETIADAPYERIVIQLKSYGGNYFDALAVVHVIQELKNQGKIVEIRIYGNAMSGGFLIALAGSKGHRKASKSALLMWHEILSFEFFKVSDVSNKENEARVFRLLQDNVNQYIVDNSKMTKEELDKRCSFKEMWVTGKDALKYGFIDEFLD